MRKIHILTISAVLLLCAILCTAGCTGSSDVIIGDWLAEDGSTVTTVCFSEDKSGCLFYDVTEESPFTTTKIDFTWENKGDNTYLLTIAGDLLDGCTLNADGSQLTLDGSVFSIYVSPEMTGLVLEKMLWE